MHAECVKGAQLGQGAREEAGEEAVVMDEWPRPSTADPQASANFTATKAEVLAETHCWAPIRSRHQFPCHQIIKPHVENDLIFHSTYVRSLCLLEWGYFNKFLENGIKRYTYVGTKIKKKTKERKLNRMHSVFITRTLKPLYMNYTFKNKVNYFLNVTD